MGKTSGKRKWSGSADFDCAGRTTDGSRYKTISDMWDGELGGGQDTPAADTWYKKSGEYWDTQEPSVDGMLGGMGDLDARDVAASRRFLEKLLNTPEPSDVALDVGAGIGRVTKHLLGGLFGTVDMLEQNAGYLERSRAFLGPDSVVEHRVCVGMQDFNPASAGDDVDLAGRYRLVWIQWCIIYLTDTDLVAFLRQCVRCLAPEGVICIKDNLARTGFLVDKEDSSISRSDKYLKALFEKAGLELVQQERQMDFPKSIFPVKMYALKPKEETDPVSPDVASREGATS